MNPVPESWCLLFLLLLSFPFDKVRSTQRILYSKLDVAGLLRFESGEDGTELGRSAGYSLGLQTRLNTNCPLSTADHKLNLPSSSTIHPVFHVSQLKRNLGNKMLHTKLPDCPKEPTLHPQAILDRRPVRRGQQAATQILDRWQGLPLPLRQHGNSLMKWNSDFYHSTSRTRCFRKRENCCR